VSVQCSNGSSWEAHRGCIVTIPLSMLKEGSITFSETPSCIGKLVQSPIELGLMNIVWILYPYKFLPEGINYIGALSSEDFTTFLIPDIKDSSGEKSADLMCQVVGSFAQEIQAMDKFQVAEIATRRLRSLFSQGTDVPDAVGCCFSNWGMQRLVKGSWSYYPTSLQKDISEESINCGNNHVQKFLAGIDEFVFYAGEAMSIEQRGTVHGSYLSGVEAAREVINRNIKNTITTYFLYL
jgi:monoamine oxidase